MRIIAGQLKGRRLTSPDWSGLRPTSDKLRETLFNVLGPCVAGARVLDGYSGTGAVGIEALSRGAAHVTFVDNDRRAADLVQANLLHCGVKERYAIIRVDFAGAAARLDRGARSTSSFSTRRMAPERWHRRSPRPPESRHPTRAWSSSTPGATSRRRRRGSCG